MRNVQIPGGIIAGLILLSSIICVAHITAVEEEDSLKIIAVADLHQRYPYGVNINDTSYVEITVWIERDIDKTDILSVNLYYAKDDDPFISREMTFLSSDSDIYICNLDIDFDIGKANNYTYFVVVWDTNFNKAISEKFWFTIFHPGFHRCEDFHCSILKEIVILLGTGCLALTVVTYFLFIGGKITYRIVTSAIKWVNNRRNQI